MKLSIKGLGFGFGIVTGLGMLVLGLFAAWFGWGNAIVAIMSDAYIGYSPTTGGAILGGIYGFIDGFIVGAIVAWVYNKMA